MSQLQVVDHTDTEPEQSEAFHSTSNQDDGDLKTEKTKELQEELSPHPPPHTEQVTMLKYRSCAVDVGFHSLTEDAEMQGKIQEKTRERKIKGS